MTETKVHIAKEDARMVQLKEVEKESGLDKPARLTIRVLLFLFLISVGRRSLF